MKLKLIASSVVLIAIVGCAPIPSTETQPFPTSTILKTTPTPTSKLQITYVQLKNDKNFTEFYTIDITCISADELCFGEPKLLFQSLKSSDTDRTLPEGYIADYDWSADGSKIVLESATDILIGDINTQEWLNITNTPEADHAPKWSTDGKFIYYIACLEDSTGMCTPQLIRYELAKRERLQLLSAWDKSLTSSYDMSSDGQKILFAVPNGISDLLYQASWDGTDIHQLTTGDVGENSPSFSPDEQKFIFVRSTIQYYIDSKDDSDIIMKELISGEERNLTERFDNKASSTSFSPDGKWIVFDAFDDNGNINIFLVSIETGEIFQVTEDGDSGFPAWRWVTK